METFNYKSKTGKAVLSLGAESAGNFSFFSKGKICFSEDFGDLMDEINYLKFEKELGKFLRNSPVKPKIVLCDLHPLLKTTTLAKKLAKRYDAQVISVQHHLAHIFSSVADKLLLDTEDNRMPVEFLGVACDGTGLGSDGKIWGGEIFKISGMGNGLKIQRVGRLENQVLLGGEKAIQEPARVLISILGRFMPEDEVFKHVGKYYPANEFKLLCNQLRQEFNCLETSSTARVLDAASVLLGFSKNERLEKHGPVALLEKNSSIPYRVEPKISYDEKEGIYILETTHLFKYLTKNLHRDKKRLAATTQKYIADGIYEISKTEKKRGVFFAGGMANNKIISKALEKKGFHMSKKIPRGDAGISIGQTFFYILANPRH